MHEANSMPCVASCAMPDLWNFAGLSILGLLAIEIFLLLSFVCLFMHVGNTVTARLLDVLWGRPLLQLRDGHSLLSCFE